MNTIDELAEEYFKRTQPWNANDPYFLKPGNSKTIDAFKAGYEAGGAQRAHKIAELVDAIVKLEEENKRLKAQFLGEGLTEEEKEAKRISRLNHASWMRAQY